MSSLDGPVRVNSTDQPAFRTGLYGSRLKHPAIPTTTRGFDNEFGKFLQIPAPAKFPAGLSWLGDFEDDIVELELITKQTVVSSNPVIVRFSPNIPPVTGRSSSDCHAAK